MLGGELTFPLPRYHVRMSGLHYEKCCKFNGENGLENSPYYRSTQALARREQDRCGAVFGDAYDLRFAGFTQCVFHSPFPLRGVVYEGLGQAFDALRARRPELCLSANHPRQLWVEDLKSSETRPDGSVLAGFVVYK